MALAKGVDVSDYQSSIPTDAAFVIIKASEGARTTQRNWRAKQTEARARGLVVGYYHFLHAENDVDDEVEHFCSTVGSVPENELLVLDFEPYGQGVPDATCTARKNAWLREVKARYPRHKVGMYANRDWWFRTDDEYADFLWIADYQAAAGQPRIEAGWRFHQYTEQPLDTNVYNGSIDDLRAWAGSAPSAPVGPAVPAGKRSWDRLVERVLSVPEGVYEGYNSRDGWDNRTQWGKQFGEDGVPWCVIFDFCMYADVGLADIVPKVDNVSVFSNWARARGQWSEYPSLGAWMNWKDGAHTEIVVGFTATTVTTKGGNTIPAGGDGGQGRGVYSHTYQRSDPRITGYFAPRFPEGRPPSADPRDPRPVAAPTIPAASPSWEDDMAYAQLPLGVTDIDSNVTVPVGPGRWRLAVCPNLVPGREQIRVRVDITEPDGSVREDDENVLWDLFNCQYGDREFNGPGAVHVQRLSYPGAHVAVNVVREG